MSRRSFISDAEMNAVNQLQNELQSVLNRYAAESDLTIAETLGVLELVKAQLLDEAFSMCDDDDDIETCA